ncbi:MAG: hypothetical protein OER21_05415 [Gemmatimonadota bacterium]|nr:hypothetical protein [Gemmatimonadota bacterium]
MPIKYAIDEDLRLVYAVAVGRVTLSDLMDHLKTLLQDPAYRRPMKKLVDYRAGHVIDMSVEETKRLTEFKLRHDETFRGEQCAFVVSDDVDFGLSRVHEMYVDPLVTTMVFRDVSDAFAWLDVDADSVEVLANRVRES